MQPTQCKTGLTDLFARQRHSLDTLNAILEREFSALEAQDTTALEQVTERKAACMQELDDLQHSLARLLAQAGFPPDREGVEACLAWCDSGGNLAAAWEALLQSLQHCRERNRDNGAAIEVHRRHTHSALAVLRGQSAHPATYAASGRADDGGDSRPLAKA